MEAANGNLFQKRIMNKNEEHEALRLNSEAKSSASE